MTEDPIIRDLRDVKDKLAREVDYDIAELARRLTAAQRQRGDTVVDRSGETPPPDIEEKRTA